MTAPLDDKRQSQEVSLSSRGCMTRGDGETWLTDGTASDERAARERELNKPRRGTREHRPEGIGFALIAISGVIALTSGGYTDQPWWSAALSLVGALLV